MAEKNRRDDGSSSSNKRCSADSTADSVPAKKLSIGFSLKKPSPNNSRLAASKPPKPGFNKKPIAIQLAKGPKKAEPPVMKKSSKVAAVFNEDSDSEPEEIPPEAKMRMRNVGRETPTSAGPNSFNKGKLGFCDAQRFWEKKQEEIAHKLQKEQ